MRSGRCAVMYSRRRRRALCRLALAAPGVPAACPGGLVGVVIQGDGLALTSSRPATRAAEHVRRGPGPQLTAGRQAEAGEDALCSGQSPSRVSGARRRWARQTLVTMPPGPPANRSGSRSRSQCDERLQDLVHARGVVGVVGLQGRAGPRGRGPSSRCRSTSSRDAAKVAVSASRAQVAVGDIHARLYFAGFRRSRGGFPRRAAQCGRRRAREIPNRMVTASPGTGTVTSCQVQSLLPGAVGLVPVAEEGPGSDRLRQRPGHGQVQPGLATARLVARRCPRKVTVRPR